MSSYSSRPRQSGKTYELSQSLAERTGLTRETCIGLMQAGWTYSETLGRPNRWEGPAASFVDAGSNAAECIIPNNEPDPRESGRRNRAALRYLHNCGFLRVEPSKHKIEAILLGRDSDTTDGRRVR